MFQFLSILYQVLIDVYGHLFEQAIPAFILLYSSAFVDLTTLLLQITIIKRPSAKREDMSLCANVFERNVGIKLGHQH